MKAESGTKPSLFEVDKVGEMAHISLFDNIREMEEEGERVFKYDYYFLELPFRDSLKADVEINYDKWVELAREKENKQSKYEPAEMDVLKKQIADQSEVLEFQEEVIFELIMKVYE